MAQATQHLIERDQQGILWDVATCDSCLAEHVKLFPANDNLRSRDYLKRTVKPIADSSRECGFCPEPEDEPCIRA